MGTLKVRTPIQKALMDFELIGQFSDGHWENSRPYDAWEDWARCEIVVAQEGELLGRDFWAKKDNWNLNSKELLDVVGDRMVNICNMTHNGVKPEFVDELNDSDYDNLLLNDDEYWIEKLIKVEDEFGSIEKLKETRVGPYDRKKMEAELKDLKKILKTYIGD